jgi:hypothetical protein
MEGSQMKYSTNGLLNVSTKTILLVIYLAFLILPRMGNTAVAQMGPEGSWVVEGGHGEGVRAPASSQPGTLATIIVDGDPSEWASIPVLINDASGDGGQFPDLISIKVANDNSFVYILQEFTNPLTHQGEFQTTSLFLDTDLDATTGCTVLEGIGMEYAIVFEVPSGGGIGDVRDCISGVDDFPGSLV